MTMYFAHSAKDGIPEQTYQEHVAEVLCMARRFAKEAAAYSHLGPLLRDVVEHAAAYHDLGKLDEENQKILRTGKGSLPIKHWDAGSAHLLAGSNSITNNLAALFVYAHHR